MEPAHKFALSSILDRLGDLIELIRCSGLAKFIKVSVPLPEIKFTLQQCSFWAFGGHWLADVMALVGKSYESCLLLAREDPSWHRRRGFRSVAKLIVEIEGQLNTCIDVLKVITIATAGDLGEANKRAHALAYALSYQVPPPPISRVTFYDPVVRSQGDVRNIRENARQLSLSICRSLLVVLDAAARNTALCGCVRLLESHRSMEQARSQLAERWFPNHNQEQEPGYHESFGASEDRIDEITRRLERTAGYNMKQVVLIPCRWLQY